MAERRAFGAIWANQDASAAAEMALVLPLLIVLLIAPFETGRFFLDEHGVIKAVRDGARYAARQSFSEYSCPDGTVSTAVTDRTRNVVRYGKPNPTDSDLPKLYYWQATTDGQPSVRLTVTCPTTLDGTEVQGGLYANKAHVPVITVSAVVEYDPLFGMFGFGQGVLNLTAESQSAVMGL